MSFHRPPVLTELTAGECWLRYRRSGSKATESKGQPRSGLGERRWSRVVAAVSDLGGQLDRALASEVRLCRATLHSWRWRATDRLPHSEEWPRSSHCVGQIPSRPHVCALSEFDRSFSESLRSPRRPLLLRDHLGRVFR